MRISSGGFVAASTCALADDATMPAVWPTGPLPGEATLASDAAIFAAQHPWPQSRVGDPLTRPDHARPPSPTHPPTSTIQVSAASVAPGTLESNSGASSAPNAAQTTATTGPIAADAPGTLESTSGASSAPQCAAANLKLAVEGFLKFYGIDDWASQRLRGLSPHLQCQLLSLDIPVRRPNRSAYLMTKMRGSMNPMCKPAPTGCERILNDSRQNSTRVSLKR
jgi:hypothetical protein